MVLERLGLGIALSDHRCAFCYAQIRLLRRQAVLAGQAVEPLIATWTSLALVGKGLALGCPVVSITYAARRLACHPSKLSATKLQLGAGSSAPVAGSERSCQTRAGKTPHR